MKKHLSLLFVVFVSISFQSHAQTILFEDFLGVTTPALPAGWVNTFTADSGTTPQGWVTITSAADYILNAIVFGHTQYAECTEAYFMGNEPANLTTPSFSLAGAAAPSVSFDYWLDGYHYYSSGIGYFEAAYVQISTDGGATWSSLSGVPGGPIGGAVSCTSPSDCTVAGSIDGEAGREARGGPPGRPGDQGQGAQCRPRDPQDRLEHEGRLNRRP